MTENKKNRLKHMQQRLATLRSQVREDFEIADKVYEQGNNLVLSNPEKGYQLISIATELYQFAEKQHKDKLSEMRRISYILYKENFKLTF